MEKQLMLPMPDLYQFHEWTTEHGKRRMKFKSATNATLVLYQGKDSWVDIENKSWVLVGADENNWGTPVRISH